MKVMTFPNLFRPFVAIWPTALLRHGSQRLQQTDSTSVRRTSGTGSVLHNRFISKSGRQFRLPFVYHVLSSRLAGRLLLVAVSSMALNIGSARQMSVNVASPMASPATPIVVAYVCSWTNERLPDPSLMTHINYAFGQVKADFAGVTVQNEPFLRKVVALKQVNPGLKVLLSIGGWTGGNFSEMAASARTRRSFARDCRRIVDRFGLDGIDIDWEYPTSSEAGISSSTDDTRHFTLLMRDLRKALGRGKFLTIATIADGLYIDFPACMPYLDFVNIMAYDVANPPYHHTTLFRSPLSGRITVAEAVEAHIRNGVPPHRLTLGMALYGRGNHSNPVLHNFVKTRHTDRRYVQQWDEAAKVPYLVDASGTLVWGFDNPASLAAKCGYILDRGLLGGMYWECTEDNAQLDGMRTIFLSLIKNRKATPAPKQLLMVDTKRQDMTAHMARQLKQMALDLQWEVTETDAEEAGRISSFDPYHLVVSDAATMSSLPEKVRKAFTLYLEESRGSYLCLSHNVTADSLQPATEFERPADSLRMVTSFFGYVGVNGKPYPLIWTDEARKGRNYHLIFPPALQILSSTHWAEQALRNLLETIDDL